MGTEDKQLPTRNILPSKAIKAEGKMNTTNTNKRSEIVYLLKRIYKKF